MGDAGFCPSTVPTRTSSVEKLRMQRLLQVARSNANELDLTDRTLRISRMGRIYPKHAPKHYTRFNAYPKPCLYALQPKPSVPEDWKNLPAVGAALKRRTQTEAPETKGRSGFRVSVAIVIVLAVIIRLRIISRITSISTNIT